MTYEGNPYRATLRRDYPEPLIALLIFILGVWLWDHYFGKPAGYEPGTEAVALLKIDRDLRLADAMEQDPGWLRSLAAVETPVKARGRALEVFQELAKEKAITLRGLEAFAVVRAVQEKLPVSATLGEMLKGQMISNFEEVSLQLENHGGTWWQAKIVDDWEKHAQPHAFWRQSYDHDNLKLRLRTVMARSSIWLLGLVGLVFLPRVLCHLRNAQKVEWKGYGGAWPFSLGFIVFLVATLASIGFSLILEIFIRALSGLPNWLWILADAVVRLLPVFIALGLIFRRAKHAVRVTGMTRPPDFRAVLGAFSLLMVLDQGLRAFFNTASANDPGGGLSLGDAGLWGLAYAVISACILAPVAEETLYRGVLFRSFWNRIGLLPAALGSSMIFSILHFYDGYGLVSVWVFGFTCAMLYASTRSLPTVIALHMLYNSSIKIPEWVVYHWPLG